MGNKSKKPADVRQAAHGKDKQKSQDGHSESVPIRDAHASANNHVLVSDDDLTAGSYESVGPPANWNKESIHRELQDKRVGDLDVKLDALVNASGEYLYRPIRQSQVDHLKMKYTLEHCTVTLVGLVKSDLTKTALKKALESGSEKVVILGGNHTLRALESLRSEGKLSIDKIRVTIYRNLSVNQAQFVSANDNYSVNDTLELNGWTLVDIVRHNALENPKNRTADADTQLLGGHSLMESLKIPYPDLSILNISNGWRFYGLLARYPAKFTADAEAFALALDDDKIRNLPGRDLMYGDGTMRVKFGHNAIKVLLKRRKDKVDSRDWKGIFEDLNACRLSSDFKTIIDSARARTFAAAPVPKVTSPVLLPANLQLSLKPENGSSGGAPLHDEQRKQNPVPAKSTSPEVISPDVVRGSTDTRAQDREHSGKKDVFAPRKSSRRIASNKRTKSLVEDSESEDEQGTKKSRLDAPDGTDGEESDEPSDAVEEHAVTSFDATERASEQEYLGELRIAPEKSGFWRQKYYELMAVRTQNVGCFDPAVEKQKVSVQEEETERLKELLRRKDQEIVRISKGRYWKDAVQIMAYLRQKSESLPTRNAVVDWFLENSGYEYPTELADSVARRVERLLDRMLVDGMILYVSAERSSSSVQGEEHEQEDKNPLIMLDPMCVIGGEQPKNYIECVSRPKVKSLRWKCAIS